MAASRHTYIHTTSANTVTLVWGSLRLAPNSNSAAYVAHDIDIDIDILIRF